MKQFKFKLKDTFQTMQGVSNYCLSLDSEKEYVIEIKEHKQKRSLNANSYLWLLLDRLAIEMSADGQIYTQEELYRKYIKEAGLRQDITLAPNVAKTFKHLWCNYGVGWFTEDVDTVSENHTIRFYYGSSCYKSKQMARLIDSIVQDCEALGIETKTPEEINNLLSLWETERNK